VIAVGADIVCTTNPDLEEVSVATEAPGLNVSLELVPG
jgi:hypothetical protein